MDPQHMLLYDIGCQKHTETVRRGEANARLAATVPSQDHRVRRRLAAGLVLLASRLQPSLPAEHPQPGRPAPA